MVMTSESFPRGPLTHARFCQVQLSIRLLRGYLQVMSVCAFYYYYLFIFASQSFIVNNFNCRLAHFLRCIHLISYYYI